MSEEKLEGYPLVTITNSTPHQAKGRVTYPGCHGDDWTALSWDTWTASGRGLCLVSRITAEVNVGGNWVGAEPYTSSGTSYSHYALVQVGSDKFTMTRLVTGAEPDPEDAEPKA